jgi:translocation and assembly module TamA
MSITKTFITLMTLYVCTLVLLLTEAGAAVQVKITVEGINGELRKNVLAYLSIEQQKKHPDLNSGVIRKLHEKAYDEIKRALEPFGYYNPIIQSALVRENSSWHTSYKIDAGSPVIIDTVNIEVTGAGAEDKRFTLLREKLPVKKGDVLNHQRFEEAKGMMYYTAARAGYLKAEILSARVNVYPEKNTAVIILHIATGPQYYFGNVIFVQETFNPEFLARYVPFRTGDTYSLSGLMALQSALNDSDYFESVELTPLIDEAEDLKVPVQVTLAALKQNKYTLGLGYGTDTGARGSMGWENRRITRTGHRTKINLRVSEIKTSLTSEYIVPLKNPRTDNFVFTAGWLTEDTGTSNSDKFFGGIRYNHKRSSWKESVYTNYEQEKFDVGTESGQTSLLIPGISWTHIRADNPVTAREGSRVFMDVRGAHEALLSDASFLQFRMQIKYIRGVTSLSRLLLRAEGAGSILNNLSELPPSVRFYAGGDNSIRGYAYNSLGPEDEEGNVIGGRHLLVGSIEFEHQIIDKWSAAVFYDVGNAIDELSDTFKKGAGFGVRWRSPVGPVRVDLGFPLDESDRSWRLHFIIGPDL